MWRYFLKQGAQRLLCLAAAMVLLCALIPPDPIHIPLA